MRNLIPFLIFMSPFFAAAQSVPNGNFEIWFLAQWAEAPEHWVTDNAQSQTTVSKDLDAHEGAFAMRVIAQPHPVGLYGLAYTLFEISAVPTALNFYAKSAVEFGAVSVSITFLNNQLEVYSETWFSSENILDYTFISVPLEQIEPEITHARITVSALVGDFVAGTAWISVDAMGFGAPMGSHNADRAHLKLFPNPTQGVLNLTSCEGHIGFVSIFDVLGKKVYRELINQHRVVLDVHHLPKGLYILVVEGVNGFAGRFVLD